VSQQPTKVGSNLDRRNQRQPGRTYQYGDKTIRDDTAGHNYGAGDAQNRGPHFNANGGHYDYPRKGGNSGGKKSGGKKRRP
jgi:filamentous hemagglutinin